MAVRLRRSPSQLLLPLAFGAHAGSLLDADRHAGERDRLRPPGRRRRALRLLRVRARRRCRSWPGRSRSSCCSASGCCRDRTPRSIAPDFSGHARTLVEQYGLDHATEALLTRGAGRGRGRDPAALGAHRRRRVFPGMVTESGDLVVLAVQRKGEDAPGETDARGRRHAAAAGHLGRRSTCSSTTRRAGRRLAGARAPPGRAARRRRQAGDRVLGGDGASCSRPERCRPRSPGCSPRARSSCPAC